MQIKPGMWSSKDRLFLLFRKSGVQFVFLVLFGGGFMLYLCYLYLFTYTGTKHDFYIIWYLYRLAVMRRLPLVEQELLTFPKHMRSLMYCLSFFLFLLVIVYCLSSDLLLWNLQFILSSKYPFIWVIRNNLSWRWLRTYHSFILVYPMTLPMWIMSNLLSLQLLYCNFTCSMFCSFTCLISNTISTACYFGHYVVCSTSIYGFWLPLWYLQTLLKRVKQQPTK
jgi:hypothetical protein